MLVFWSLVLLLVAEFLQAAVFTSPIHINPEPLAKFLDRRGVGEYGPFHEVLRFRERRRRVQVPMNPDDGISASHRHRVEIWVRRPSESNPRLPPVSQSSITVTDAALGRFTFHPLHRASGPGKPAATIPALD